MSAFQKIMKKLRAGAYFPLYYTFLKRVKVDPKTVLLESRHGLALESSIFALLKELSKSEYDAFRVVVPAKAGKLSEYREKLQEAGLSRAYLVRHGSIRYYLELSRAGALVNDVSFPGRFVKKEGQRILNVWHGTPLKKMGRDDLQERASLGNMLRCFLMSDYLLYPNRFMEWVMVSSFQLDRLYQGKILHTGYPRNDVFFSEGTRERVREELHFGGKQVIAYLPTYRGLSYQVNLEARQVRLQILRELDAGLGDNQVILYKPHPMEGGDISKEGFAHILPFPSHRDTSTVLCGCDGLLTDYSSVFFDFAVTGRPIVLFPYDKEEYLAGRGQYLDFGELPFPAARDVGRC